MVYTLKREQQLNCKLEDAWDFFASPGNLSSITPPGMKFKVLTDMKEDSIYEGMIIDYKVSPLFNWPLSWRTVITQVDALKSFTDFQKKGPYKSWEHFHEFIPAGGGILMRDTVSYELPMGILGTWAHRWLVHKKLVAIFDYRYKVLEEMFNKN